MLPFQLVRRAVPSRAMQWLTPVLAAALTLVVGLAIFAALGQDPVRAFRVYFVDPISDANGVSELLLKASPLCLIALGLAIGFRANVWNIGAEGRLDAAEHDPRRRDRRNAVGVDHRVPARAAERERDPGEPHADLRGRP